MTDANEWDLLEVEAGSIMGQRESHVERTVIRADRSPVARACRVMLTLLLFGNVSCDLREAAYFQDRVNEVTQEKVAKRYGYLHKTEVLQDGGRRGPTTTGGAERRVTPATRQAPSVEPTC